MEKEFNWLPSFKKTFESPEEKTIVKCAVCGNMHYLPVSKIKEAGFEKLQDRDAYVCSNCLDVHYLLADEAKEIDAEYVANGGDLDAEIFGEPFLLDRTQYTWDEAQDIIDDYNKSLKTFLSIKDPEFYKQYKNLF